jgi:predicted O-methyltransferase YrrM
MGSEARRARIREVIDRLVADGAVAASDGTTHTLFPVAAGPAECEALAGRVIAEGAAHTIEIGLGYAMSALHICEGLVANDDPTAHHVAIDPHQDRRFAGCGLRFLYDAGVADLVGHYAEESQIVLPRFLAGGRRFDLAFVDGNHRFDGVFLDLVYLGRLLRPGAIVFLDDYQLASVAKAASFCRANLGWTLEEASFTDDRHHWVVLRTSTAPDARPFDYFIDF